MNYGNVQFDEVTMSYSNTADESSRAERISRLTLEYVQQLVERDLQQIGADVEVDCLRVPPVFVSFETMSDEDIARAGAERIFQALTQAV